MWFSFPSGTDQVSVNQQIFRPEYTDGDGLNYFRAPDHFAPTILDLPGFRASPPQGDDVPHDLPPGTLGERETVTALGGQIDALKTELQNRDELIAQASRERDEANQRASLAEERVAELTAQIDELKALDDKGGSSPKPNEAAASTKK